MRVSFHEGRGFGTVFATLVAGDRLPPMYPEMTMWVLGCSVGEASGRIKNLAINYVRNRKLDDGMMERNAE